MQSIALATLGWTDALAAAFAPHAAQGLVPARVSLEHNHVYRVLAEDGERLAEAAGRIKHEASGRHELPAVGDWVAVRLDDAGGRSVIRAILPRRGWFSRKAAGRETEQNRSLPPTSIPSSSSSGSTSRSIAAASIATSSSRAGAARRPVIVLNKADLVDDVAP